MRYTRIALGLLVVSVAAGCGGSSSDAPPGNSNLPPTANAGTDQTGVAAQTITLDGSGSSDPNGDVLSFTWQFTPRAGSSAVLTAPDTASPSFVADLRGDYLAQLTVSDGRETRSDSVVVTIVNSSPIAAAGSDQVLIAAGTAFIDASSSTDLDGDELSYQWEITNKPAGSTAALSGSGQATEQFVVDLEGSYTVQLVVNDGFVDSAPDLVTVVAESGGGPVLLTGPPQSLAVDSLYRRNGGFADQADIDNGIVLTRFESLISTTATVQQVNDVLVQVGGGLSTMLPDFPFVTIDVPGITNVGQADQIAIQLLASGAFVHVDSARATDVTELLPVGFETTTPLPNQFNHLVLAKAPAAWNVRDLVVRTASEIPLLVSDRFDSDALDPGAAADIPMSFSTSSENCPNVEHGWYVASIAAAEFDAILVTGSHPAPEASVSRQAVAHPCMVDWVALMFTVAEAFPAGRFVLNTSQGYNDPNFIAYSPAMRASHAITWQVLAAGDSSRFIHISSSGNLGQVTGDDSRSGSPFRAAGNYPNPCLAFGLMGDELSNCQLLVRPDQLDNVVMVGGTTAQGTRYANSSLPSDVDAQSVGLQLLCVPASCSQQLITGPAGTSLAAPQIAGLAALLWNLDPDLSVVELKDRIVTAVADPAASVRQIDMYKAVLSIDSSIDPPSASNPVRSALLDVDPAVPDGIFDESDVISYLIEFQLASAGPDYSRFDLNGDGYTGGANSTYFDLNADRTIAPATIQIEDQLVDFQETAVTDAQILCYYAYSDLYELPDDDAIQERFALLAGVVPSRLTDPPLLSDDCGVEVLHYYEVDGVYEPPVCVNVEFDNPSSPNELALISDRAADFDFVELRVRDYAGPGTYVFDGTDRGSANVSVVDQASFPYGFGWPQGELTIDESVESYGTAYSGTYDLTVTERIVDPVTLVISRGTVQMPWAGRFLVVGLNGSPGACNI